ncbi:MAG: DivIVA domain-containing protein [Clostridia bacterium]|nr:DivIVA domain-containing protein [Clostridia bacterium]
MLSPQDIKNKTFGKTVFGYNTDEVDSYIDFICEKYESICLEKDELQYKLDAAVDGLSSSDKKLNSDEAQEAIMIAKKKADEIIAEAEEKSRLLYKAAQENADRVLKDFRRQIEDEARLLDYLKKHTDMMKKQIIKTYRDAIKEAETLAPDEKYKSETNVDVLVKTVLSGIKEDIAEGEKAPVQKANEKRPTPVRGEAAKFKGRTIRDKIKAINYTSNDEITAEIGELITDTEDKKDN